MDIDPEARTARVPTLILQPLVENAVKHGLANLRGLGRIEIRARREGDHLILSVRDTGPGPRPGSDAGATSNGVGLRNTEARLRQMYGEESPLSLRAAEGGGAIAEVRIPYRPDTGLEAQPAARAGGE
jgi:sensor histidine kinase YesM